MLITKWDNYVYSIKIPLSKRYNGLSLFRLLMQIVALVGQNGGLNKNESMYI